MQEYTKEDLMELIIELDNIIIDSGASSPNDDNLRAVENARFIICEILRNKD